MHPDLDPQPGTLAGLLRELPDEAAPPYAYHEFERRAVVRAQAARSHAGSRRLAVAGVLLLAVLAVLVRLVGISPIAPARGVSAAVSSAPGPDLDDAPPFSRTAAGRWLASLPREPAVVRVGPRAAVMGLEDRIAQIDDLLSAARAAGGRSERLRALQQERVRLVGTLVQVRYAQTLANAAP